MQIESDARDLVKLFFNKDCLEDLIQKSQLSFVNYTDMVATPGRLIDLVEQKEVWLDQIEFLVIDEVDRLLDMGFIPSVKRIVRYSPRKEQTTDFIVFGNV